MKETRMAVGLPFLVVIAFIVFPATAETGKG